MRSNAQAKALLKQLRFCVQSFGVLTDLISQSYVFLNSSISGILKKFIVLHEIGHLTPQSNAPVSLLITARVALVTSLLLIPFTVTWSWLSIGILSIFLLQFSDLLGYRLFNRVSFARLWSEIVADQFAASHLTPSECAWMEKFIKLGYWGRDKAFTYAENQIRLTALLDAIAGKKNEWWEWLDKKLSYLIFVRTMVILTTLILLAFFASPPSIELAICTLLLSLILFSFVFLFSHSEKWIQNEVNQRVKA